MDAELHKGNLTFLIDQLICSFYYGCVGGSRMTAVRFLRENKKMMRACYLFISRKLENILRSIKSV